MLRSPASASSRSAEARPATALARTASALLLVSLLALAAPPGALASDDAALRGRVTARGQALPDTVVTLYAGGRSGADVLGRARVNAAGVFSLPYRPPEGRRPLYVVARPGEGSGFPRAVLVSVLGTPDRAPGWVVVDELTTVGSVWPTARFLGADGQMRGNDVGLANAAGNVANLVDVATGQPSAILTAGVNLQTTTLSTLYSLATLIGACAAGEACDELLRLATPPGGEPPADTLAAAVSIARHPWHNVSGLFELARRLAGDATFPPVLRYEPTAWTLSVLYTGGGLDAPGGLAIDAEGFIWANNNFLAGSQSFLRQRGYGGLGITQLSPDGRPLSPPFGFRGGGILGAGFGFAIDPRGHFWIGNFAGNSVSELDSEARPVSPPGGYTASGTTYRVQGTVADPKGNVWAANYGSDPDSPRGDSVTFFPAERPLEAVTFEEDDGCSFDRPFGVAVDGRGRAWVANMGDGTVSIVTPDGCREDPIPAGEGAQGVAIDSRNNVWVTNDSGKSLTWIDPARRDTRTFDQLGLEGPWGLAVDGDDNVWVADFFGRKIVQVCGARELCPPGLAMGDPIATYGGNGGLQHMTSVVVDQAGNLFAANNNDVQHLCDVPPPTDSPPSAKLERESMECGGNGILAIYGVAAPVAAPLLGPPRRP